jgi:hypothetical protein
LYRVTSLLAVRPAFARTLLLVLVFSLSTGVWAAGVPGRSAAPPSDAGGPDGFGYCFETTQDLGDTIQFSWIDPSTHPVLTDWHPNPDDGWTRIALPFGLPFYGDTLDSIVVCTNGFIEFPTTFTSYANSSLPVSSIPGLIAAFWDDLSPAQSGCVRRWDDMANHATVITWDNVVRFNTCDTLSFQVVLAADGRIQINVLQAPGVPNSATVGIQGNSGADGWYLEYVCDSLPGQHVLADRTSIRFSVRRFAHDVGVLEAGTPQGWVPVNSQMPVTATFRNFGTNTETFTVSASVVHVHFPFDTGYTCTRQVAGLAPFETAGVYFGDWLVPPSPDSWKVVFRTNLPGDEFPYNDSSRCLTTSVPPALGSVLGSWDLSDLGDGMNLAGITHRADSNRFYFTCLDPNRVYSFTPDGPGVDLRQEPFQLQNFFGDDAAWGIGWDERDSCFWISHSSTYGPGCIAARYKPDGSFTGDTWNLGNLEPGVWFAGLDITREGLCHAVEVGGGNRVYKLDFGVKGVLGYLPGPVASWRACAYVGDRECYLLAGGWNQNALCRLSSSGEVIETASLPGLADLDVYRPESLSRDSLVWAYVTVSNNENTIRRISAGRTWATVALGDGPAVAGPQFALAVSPNPCRGSTVLRLMTGTRDIATALRVFDASGRLVRSVPVRTSSFALRTSDLAAGIYLLTATTPRGNLSQKLAVLDSR